MNIGHSLIDLNDKHVGGIPGIEVVSYNTVPALNADQMIAATIRQHIPNYKYTNKMLVVTGETHNGSLVAMGSYDNRMLHTLVFKPLS